MQLQKVGDFCDHLEGRIDSLDDEMQEMCDELMGEDTGGFADNDDDDNVVYHDDVGSTLECVPVVAEGCEGIVCAEVRG